VNQVKASLATKATHVSIADHWSGLNLLMVPGTRFDLPHSHTGPMIFVGQMLGHYRVLEKISHGAMGVVYRAHDEHLEREVALKVMAPESLRNPAARKRFRNEALLLSKLNHPNIVSVHDFDTEGCIDFLVMEYVEGPNLAERLESGPLNEDEVVHIGRQIVAAIQEAHEHGIIHRDLKPHNIMLTPSGRVKVADFGLAKHFRRAIAPPAIMNLARTMEIVGTLPYMSPEQLRGQPTDCRSDIYSAGALLYEIATGRRAFPQRQRPRLVNSILNDAPGSSGALRHWVSSSLETILAKCMEKDPGRRYQSAAELSVDLGHLSTAAMSRSTGINSNCNVIGWPGFLGESSRGETSFTAFSSRKGWSAAADNYFLRRVCSAFRKAGKTISGFLSSDNCKGIWDDDLSSTRPPKSAKNQQSSRCGHGQFSSHEAQTLTLSPKTL
jgi:serine/threonine protein kinase